MKREKELNSIAGISFPTSEELLEKIVISLATIDIELSNISRHSYHFIIELKDADRKIGRLKIHYNKNNQCNKVHIVDSLIPKYFEILSTIFPFSNKKIAERDFLQEFLEINYKFELECFYQNSYFICYIVRKPKTDDNVWIKVLKNENKTSCYLQGNQDLFDEVSYLIREI